MRKLKRMLKNIRLVYRRSSTLTKTVVLSAIVLSLAALLTLSLSIRAYDREAQKMKDQAAQLEQENATLESKIENQGSAEGVEQFAKDELGLVDPDTVILVPEQ